MARQGSGLAFDLWQRSKSWNSLVRNSAPPSGSADAALSATKAKTVLGLSKLPQWEGERSSYEELQDRCYSEREKLPFRAAARVPKNPAYSK